MANVKISALAALGGAPATGDLILMVDVSDVSMAPTGTNKSMTNANVLTFINANAAIPAAQVSAGTFGAGNFVFSGVLDVTNNLNANGIFIAGKRQTTTLAYIGDPTTVNTKYIVFSRAAVLTDTVDMSGVNGGIGPADFTLQKLGGNIIVGTDPGGASIFRVGGVIAASGSLLLTMAGAGLSIKSGANARIGESVLGAGTVTVANTSVTANTKIWLTRRVAAGTVGDLTYTTNPGVGFTITSLNPLDTSTVEVLLIEMT